MVSRHPVSDLPIINPRNGGLKFPPPPPPHPTTLLVRSRGFRRLVKYDVVNPGGISGLVGTLLSILLSRVPGGVGSLTRGLPPIANEDSFPSLLPFLPGSVEGVDGSAYLDLPDLVWDQNSGIAQIGSFPVCGRLLFFLAAWQRITSDNFVLEVIRQGYSLPFVELLPLSLSPMETPLPKLLDK